MNPRPMLLSLVAVLGLAACGGTTPPPTPTPSLNGEQTKTPGQVLTDAHDALKAAKSLHLDAQFTDAQGSTNFASDIDLTSQSAHLVGTQRGGHFESIVSGGKVYLNGDAAFFKAIGQESLGTLFAGQWVIPPPASALVSGLIALVDRANFADCVLGQTHGTLSGGNPVDAQGNPSYPVNDAGDVPGSAPLTINVSLVGTAYPVMLKHNGPTKSGGPSPPACSLASTGVSSGTVTLTKFNTPVSVSAPANPIDLSLLGGGPVPASPSAASPPAAPTATP